MGVLKNNAQDCFARRDAERLLAATGATSLALMTIKPSAAARPLATTHLQSLQDEMALP
jgi:hypothetical protein